MSAAYWQLFWQTAKSKAITIGAIDSLAGILTGAQNFFAWSAICSGPHLVAFALFTWLVPWTMIVPPGTLTVTTVANVSEADEWLQVPAFQNASFLNSFARARFDTTNESGPYARYLGYSHNLFQTAMGMAFSGDIPVVKPPHVNSSYGLDYFAPAVKCQNTSAPLLDAFDLALDYDNGLLGMKATTQACAGLTTEDGCHAFLYLGWVPGTDEVPFQNLSIPQGRLPSVSKLGPPSDGNEMGPARFYVATNFDDQLNWNVLNCSLHNSSYSATFDFEAGNQRIAITNRTLLQPMSARTPVDFDYSDVDAVHWMYQAIMELMGQLISGSVSFMVDGRINPSSPHVALVADDLQIIYTNVALSRELSFIVGPHQSIGGIFNVTSTDVLLADTIETLAANQGLALVSREEFLMPSERPTSVKTVRYVNVYAYNAQRL